MKGVGTRIPNPGVAGSSPAGGAKFLVIYCASKSYQKIFLLPKGSIFFVKNLKGKGP